MELTRRGFLKGLAKVAAIAGVATMAPSALFAKPKKKIIHTVENGGAVLLEPDRDIRDVYAKSAGEAYSKKIDEHVMRSGSCSIDEAFIRQYERDLQALLKQKGSLLRSVPRETIT